MDGAENHHSPAAALAAWLDCLDEDRDRAGDQYEQLRRKLTLFFGARQCNPWAEELADRTLDVVGRRLKAGAEIYAREVSHYCYGVAQNILRDHRKRAKLESLRRDTPP